MRSRWTASSLGFLLAASSAPIISHCEVYLSEDQALKAIFPGEIFSGKTFQLMAEEIRKIEDKSGQRVRSPSLKTWVSSNKDLVIVDQVLGKHEYITFAVGVTRDGKVKGVEILEYRESYGSQVKSADWRKQFLGKTKEAPLKVGEDINNISGATLSSTHVTAGVKRIMQTYDCIRERI